jgi:hypothetical protein
LYRHVLWHTMVYVYYVNVYVYSSTIILLAPKTSLIEDTFLRVNAHGLSTPVCNYLGVLSPVCGVGAVEPPPPLLAAAAMDDPPLACSSLTLRTW